MKMGACNSTVTSQTCSVLRSTRFRTCGRIFHGSERTRIRRTRIAQDRGKKNSLNLEETVRASRPNIDTKAATELGQRLILLAARAHPLLRPEVVAYQLAAELLARKRR